MSFMAETPPGQASRFTSGLSHAIGQKYCNLGTLLCKPNTPPVDVTAVSQLSTSRLPGLHAKLSPSSTSLANLGTHLSRFAADRCYPRNTNDQILVTKSRRQRFSLPSLYSVPKPTFDISPSNPYSRVESQEKNLQPGGRIFGKGGSKL